LRITSEDCAKREEMSHVFADKVAILSDEYALRVDFGFSW